MEEMIAVVAKYTRYVGSTALSAHPARTAASAAAVSIRPRRAKILLTGCIPHLPALVP